MSAVGWDTWAFLEIALDGPRKDEVVRSLATADHVFTTRDVIVETYGYLVRKGRSAHTAWKWLEHLAKGRFRIHDPEYASLIEFAGRIPLGAKLSLVDVSVALAAARERTAEIATGDSEFRKVGLVPLFAHRDPS